MLHRVKFFKYYQNPTKFSFLKIISRVKLATNSIIYKQDLT